MIQKNFIILGPPGSGKGTISNLLSAFLNIPHISSGDIFRDEVRKKTPFGIEIAERLGTGIFVPDKQVLPVIMSRLGASDCKNGYILDGFPRNQHQAEHLDGKVELTAAINLISNENLIVSRSVNRRVCPGCNEIYNLVTSPPTITGICNNCKTPLVHRRDDAEEVVKKRLKTYNEQTAPLIQHYYSLDKLVDVDALGEPIDIFERVVTQIVRKSYRPSFSRIA